MLAMSREDAFVAFFRQLSDLVLQPGDFDFMEAGARMACEGGELYYLVAGHLGLMSMGDPLRSFLGQDDSEGNAGEGGVTVTGAQRDALERLSDPMRLMRLFAVANETGGEDEVRGYLRGLEGHLSAVASNESTLFRSRSIWTRRWTWPVRFYPSPLLRAVERAPQHSNSVRRRRWRSHRRHLRCLLRTLHPWRWRCPPHPPLLPEDTVPLPAGPSAVPLPSAPSDAAPVPEPVIADLDDRRKTRRPPMPSPELLVP